MPPRRSATKGKATRGQQSKITDRKLRTVKKSQDSNLTSHDADVKPPKRKLSQEADTEKKLAKVLVGIERGGKYFNVL